MLALLVSPFDLGQSPVILSRVLADVTLTPELSLSVGGSYRLSGAGPVLLPRPLANVTLAPELSPSVSGSDGSVGLDLVVGWTQLSPNEITHV